MREAHERLAVRRIDPTVSIIDVRGDLTGAAEDALMAAYAEASGAQTSRIVLDFGGLAYMNSSGIGLLVTLLVRVQRQGQRLLAFGMSEHYRHIFELTRLDEAIGVYDTAAAALAAEGAGPRKG
jgi:anti-sigma B factor antagonist